MKRRIPAFINKKVYYVSTILEDSRESKRGANFRREPARSIYTSTHHKEHKEQGNKCQYNMGLH
jgi:hypothetical protein